MAQEKKTDAPKPVPGILYVDCTKYVEVQRGLLATTARAAETDEEYVPKKLVALAKLDGEVTTLLALGDQLQRALATTEVRLDAKLSRIYSGLFEFVNAELQPRVARLTGGA